MLTYGFYNSAAGDRRYNAVQISRLFEGIINDGVFASIGDSFAVEAGSGMTVNVGTGRAWFNNTWTNNDALIPVALDSADVILNRIDAVILEVADAVDVRTNSVKVIKGVAASVPAEPTLTNTTGLHQYPLAVISVGAGVTSITQDKITSKVNTASCPFATLVGLDALLPVWENEFNTWFADLQAQMMENVATNLQNQITANKVKYGTCASAAAQQTKIVTQAEFSLAVGAHLVVAFTNINTANNPTLNVNNTGVVAIYCNGALATADQLRKVAEFEYDGVYFQLLNPGVNTDIINAQRDSYMAFCSNVNAGSLDAAFGKNNEASVLGIGNQLALYAWYKGANKVSYPFTNLKACSSFQNCLDSVTAFAEILGNADIMAIIALSPYALNLYNTGLDVRTGKALASLAGLNPNDYANLAALLASSTAMATVAASAPAMNAISINSSIMSSVIASATAMTAVVSSGLALNTLIKASVAKTSLIANQATFNTYVATMLTTMDAATTYFTKSVADASMNATTVIAGTANSFVYVKVVTDSSNLSNYNWGNIKHNHDGTTELVHDPFPSTSGGTGSVTVNKFAVGGLKATVPYVAALSFTADKYEAV